MTALAAAKRITKRGPSVIADRRTYPVKAGVKIYKGAIVVLQAGYARPATGAAGLTTVGIAKATADNTNGSNGTINVDVEQGTFAVKCGSASDALTQANVGATVYLIDDQTVGAVNS